MRLRGIMEKLYIYIFIKIYIYHIYNLLRNSFFIGLTCFIDGQNEK